MITKNSAWKWHAGPAEPDSLWMSPSYSDAAWSQGPGALGYGEPYIATVVPWGPSAGNKWRTTYFRHTFTLGGDPSVWSSMLASVNFDDGFVMYLNGTEILRMFMPPGPVAWDSLAGSHEGGAYEPVDLSAHVSHLVVGDNVLAVEVHQHTKGSSDLVWDAELLLPCAITRGPYVQLGASDGMSVRWRTNVPTTGQVWLGDDPGALVSYAVDLTPKTEHEFRFTDLNPATHYAYAVGTTDTVLAGGDADHVFKTHPVPGADVDTRIWVIGDSGHPNNAQAATRDSYMDWTGERGTDVWLMLGDNAYPGGTDPEYQAAVFDRFQPLLRKVPVWPTRGNHDRTFALPAIDIYDIFTLPTAGEGGGLPSGSERYFSFDYGQIHFVCLDSEGANRLPGSPMHAWLREDLAATERTWVLAYWHHPPYSKGSHDSDNDLDSGGRMGDMRRHVLPILDSLGVDLVMTGHSHSYERSFLLNGYYNTSIPLTAYNIVDGGTGRAAVDSVYRKPTHGTGPFEGAVYVVAGSAATTSGGPLNHPVMVESLNLYGSLVIDVRGNRLDARFLTNTGAIRDSFTIVKGVHVLNADGPPAKSRHLALRQAGPNPNRGNARFRMAIPEAGRVRVNIMDIAGRVVATPAQGPFAAGEHTVRWNGRDRTGRSVAPGVYFAVLEAGRERRAVRFVLTR